jgi:signal peptidase II
LAVFALLALIVLFLTRHHFDVHTRAGQVALGIISGGIAGNLLDRFLHGYVIDFIYFYLERRGAGDLGFPAFNVADTAICTGVALLFLLSWQKDAAAPGRDERTAIRGD